MAVIEVCSDIFGAADECKFSLPIPINLLTAVDAVYYSILFKS